jgi:uncharacterized protein (DUF488 family)
VSAASAQARVATIGFTGSTARRFFERLAAAGVRTVIDVRLHATSQLAGFAKEADLPWFLERIGGIDYRREPALAPTDDMLKTYRTTKGGWATYETSFLALMASRRIEERFPVSMFDGACLLCSEATPHQCHRRLVCDYLNAKWGGALAVHHL